MWSQSQGCFIMSYTNPSDPQYCCNSIPSSYCRDNSSDYFEGNGWKPKSIIVGFIEGIILSAVIVGIHLLDKSLRLSPERWKHIYVFTMPNVMINSVLFSLFITANQYYFNLVWFYVL